MSQLSDKILSYAVETYIPMHSAAQLSAPEMYGTYLPTSTPYMTSSEAIPIYQSTVNPAGAEGGSWLFTVPTTGNRTRIRTNQTTYANQKVWDGLYGFGIWLKINSMPTGTTTSTHSLFSTARSSSFPGFSISLRGQNHTSGPAIMHNLFGASTTPIVTNPVVGQWYYIVGRKNRSTNGATIWVNGVKVATGTNTTFVEPVTSAELAYQLIFEGNAASATNAMTYNLCHAHLMDFTTFTDAAIADIYQAGSTPPSTRTVKYFNGTSWVDSIGQKVWNGTAWVDWNAKRFDGSTWVNV